MRPVPYQATLFETSEPKPTHSHYATSSSVAYKVGMVRGGEFALAGRMKRDGQFKGHAVIFVRPAPGDCEIHRVNGKDQCDWETNWWRAHGADRLPSSEQGRVTEEAITAMRFLVGRDPKGLARLEWMRRNGLSETA